MRRTEELNHSLFKVMSVTEDALLKMQRPNSHLMKFSSENLRSRLMYAMLFTFSGSNKISP